MSVRQSDVVASVDAGTRKGLRRDSLLGKVDKGPFDTSGVRAMCHERHIGDRVDRSDPSSRARLHRCRPRWNAARQERFVETRGQLGVDQPDSMSWGWLRDRGTYDPSPGQVLEGPERRPGDREGMGIFRIRVGHECHVRDQ